jgi:hypothetical protein
MKKCNQLKKVIDHLKGDSKTWNKLSTESKSEEKSDKKLIKKLDKKKKGK